MSAACLRDALKKFDIKGGFVNAKPCGSGHINDTFLVTFERDGVISRYIAQRINDNIFKNPVKVMENIAHVTGHLRKKAERRGQSDIQRRVLTLVQTLGGENLAYDADGRIWRCYVCIEGASSWDIVKTPGQAYEAAKAFGAFQRDLMDYDGPELFETIPMFHHTPSRFAALQRAVREDVKNRAAFVKAEIDFAMFRETLANSLQTLLEKGVIPERITHNDTKLNNVLLDDITGKGLCVLDLDTVMPGMSLHDFGDMARSAANPVAEDEQDLRKVAVQVPIFEALARGYMEGAEGALLPIEKDHLTTSFKLLTFECGIRFLTDYLQGDTYFKTKREAHNLDRCRVQFALLKSIEEHEERLMKIVADGS